MLLPYIALFPELIPRLSLARMTATAASWHQFPALLKSSPTVLFWIVLSFPGMYSLHYLSVTGVHGSLYDEMGPYPRDIDSRKTARGRVEKRGVKARANK